MKGANNNMKKRTLKGAAMLALVSTSVVALAACGGRGSSSGSGSAGHYTYNTSLTIAPTTWNTHNWETSEQSYIQGFTEMGLYDVILNSTKNGYEFVSEMASDFPHDLVKENKLSAQERIEAMEILGSEGNLTNGQIWEIDLNQNAKWEDGTPITAEDYIKSMELQLSPQYVNYRADSYYANNFVIANAERYFKQGRSTLEPAYTYIDKENTSQAVQWTDTNAYNDGLEVINIGKYNPAVDSLFSDSGSTSSSDITLETLLSQFGGDDTVSQAVRLACLRIDDAVKNYLIDLHVTSKGDTPDSGWEEVEQPSDITTEQLNADIDIQVFDTVKIKVRTEISTVGADGKEDASKFEDYSRDALVADLNTIAQGLFNRNTWANKQWAYLCFLFVNYYNDDTVDFSEVGIKAVEGNPYKFRLYLAIPMSSLDLRFSLTSNWLVKTDLYERLTETLPGGTTVRTKYGTLSADNYMSYGPYRLETYSTTSFRIVRNENWYGYTDGKHEGQYQMDELYTRIIPKQETALNEFMAGRLDDVELTRDNMKDYGDSERRTTTLESYTQKISFNSDRASLLSRQTTGVNKTILANLDFRKGLSLGINRQSVANVTSGSQPFTGLLNSLYLTDVASGEKYRNTEQGKSVYTNLYKDLGGTPDNKTALAESANGYNSSMAAYYVANAIETELDPNAATGHLVNGDKIRLDLRVYDATSETTVDMNFELSSAFDKTLKDAVALLKQRDPQKYSNLNLTIEINAVTDQDYYNTAKTGNFDMIFSIWGGANIAPYNLMQVYCDADFTNTCEYGFKGKQNDPKVANLWIDLNGNGSVDSGETKTIHAWYTSLTDGTYYEPDGDRDEQGNFIDESEQARFDTVHNQKLTILSSLELAILQRWEAVPLLARGTSTLTSWKVENATDTYYDFVGFGGIRFMTFTYDDAEWAALVDEAGGNLSDEY